MSTSQMLYCGKCKHLQSSTRFKVKKNGEYQKTCQSCLGHESAKHWFDETLSLQLDVKQTRNELIRAISLVEDPSILGACLSYIAKRMSQNESAP